MSGPLQTSFTPLLWQNTNLDDPRQIREYLRQQIPFLQWVQNRLIVGGGGTGGGGGGTGMVYKGTVATSANLPTTGNKVGDMWVTTNDGHAHVWNGASWDDIGVAAGQGPPGNPGTPGAPGATGNPGLNAFNITSGPFTIPAVGSTVTVTIQDASWCVVGEMVYVANAGGTGTSGAMRITAIAGNTLTLLNPVVSSGAGVPEAPTDGQVYGRQNSAWVTLGQVIPTGVMLDFAGTTASVPTGFLACDGTSYSTTGTYAALFGVIGYNWGGSGTSFNVPDFRGKTAIGSGTGTYTGATNRVLAATGGEELHALVVGETAVHNHAIATGQFSHSHSIAAGQFSHNHAIAAGQFSHTHSASDSGHTHYYDLVATSTPGGAAIINIPTGSGSGSTVVTTRVGNAVISVSTNTLPGGSDSANTLPAGSAAAATLPAGSTSNSGSGTAHNNMQPFAVVTKIIKT